MGPIASPTPKKLLKKPDDTLLSSSPLSSGNYYSIACNISGKIGITIIAVAKPRMQRPMNIIVV